MEIKTCEQYVLAQLCEQQDENDRLCAELRRRDERIEELEASLAAFDSPMQRAIIKAGRASLLREYGGYCYSGAPAGCEAAPFTDWAFEYVLVHKGETGFSREEFINEFETELRGIYEKMRAEEDADE